MSDSNDISLITRTIELLRAEPALYSSGKLDPLSKAASLVLPDGSQVPEVVRLWAAFDNRYPTYLSSRRTDVRIADSKGKMRIKPMAKIFKAVCLDSILDEIGDEKETVAYLKDLIVKLTEKHPGFGVQLDPDETPDRILWLPPDGRAMLLWYEDDAVNRQESFSAWVGSLFEPDPVA